MKRLGAVLLFLLLVAALFGGISYYAEIQNEKKRREEIPAEKLLVYTELPESVLEIFDEPFYNETGVRLTVEALSREQMKERIKKGGRPDVYVVSQDFLHELRAEGEFSPYVSDRTDTVLNNFKDEEGCWTGVWLNPAVFAVNTEFARFHPAFAYTWEEVFHRRSVRLVMTDCIAADYAEDSLMGIVENYGVEEAFERLRDASSHVVQYGKYLSTPAHMAAMDKCDIGVSGYNEAMRVQAEKLPIRILYPEDGTHYYLYGVAISRESREPHWAQNFVDWLLSPGSREELMRENGYYFIYTNDTRMPEDDAGKKPDFWPLEKRYTAEGKKALLERWIGEIRFGK